MPGSGDPSGLIGEIYDAALDGGRWPRVLEGLARRFGSTSAHLSVEDYAMTRGRIVSVGTDPAYARRYAEHYVTCNVILRQRILHRPSDDILTNRIIMPKEELRRSEFFNDYLRPQGGEELLISVPLQQRDAVTHVTLWRPERFGIWGREEMDRLAALTPHLRRALQVNQRVGDLGTVHDLADEALDRLDYGVVLVCAEGRMLYANRLAETVLAEGAGLRVERRRLAARRAAETATLRRLIFEAARGGTGGSLAIAREERAPLILLVIPPSAEPPWDLRERPGAIIFIKDPERVATPSLTQFACHFDLTPAQAALAREMFRGDGVAAAAGRLGISYATARKHLLQIFQKTDTSRQAELVRLLQQWNEVPARHEEP